MFRKLVMSTAGAGALLASAAPASAAVTIGTDHAGNCFPFSCGYTGTYQQVYSSTAFSGLANISTVDFFAVQNLPGTLNTALYTIKFYYTNKAVDGLSNIPAENTTSLLSNFGVYQLSGVAPSTLSFQGSSFLYDPGQGNLLLDIFVSNVTSFGTSSQQVDFDAGDLSSRNYYGNTDSFGLVTRFDATPAGAIPEPATWVMMLVGFGAIGGVMRRKKCQIVRFNFA